MSSGLWPCMFVRACVSLWVFVKSKKMKPECGGEISTNSVYLTNVSYYGYIKLYARPPTTWCVKMAKNWNFTFLHFFSLEFNCTYAMAFTYVEWYAYTWNTRAMYIYGAEESRYAEYQMNSELNICIKLLLWISKRILSSYSLFLFFRLATLFFSIEFSFHFSVSFLHTFLAIRLPLRRRGRH